MEHDKSYEEMVEAGLDPETVRSVIRMVDHAEYKRLQAPPGIKITERPSGATAGCRSPTDMEKFGDRRCPQECEAKIDDQA